LGTGLRQNKKTPPGIEKGKKINNWQWGGGKASLLRGAKKGRGLAVTGLCTSKAQKKKKRNLGDADKKTNSEKAP